jgi:hypothetical protein
MDTAALNACVIWAERNQGWMSSSKDRRRKFLLGLSKEIALPQITRTVNNLLILTGIFFTVLDYWFQCKKSRGNKVQGCCSVCPGNRDRRIRTICDKCGVFVCKDHC